jgi:hypothetical protein
LPNQPTNSCPSVLLEGEVVMQVADEVALLVVEEVEVVLD